MLVAALRADLSAAARLRGNYFAGTVIEDNDILGNHRTGIELAGGDRGRDGLGRPRHHPQQT